MTIFDTRRKNWLAGAAMALVLYAPTALAQGLPPDGDFGDFEVGTQADSGSDFLSVLRRNLSFSVGTMSASSDFVERSMSTVEIGIDTEIFDGFKLVALARATNFDNTFSQTLRNPNIVWPQSSIEDSGGDVTGITPHHSGLRDQNGNVLEDAYRVGDVFAKKRSVTVKGDDTDLNEGYIQWDLSSIMTLRAGRQRLLWGQFNLLSPATVSLPPAASGTATRSGKADLLYPQDVVSLSIFPLDNLEVTLFQSAGARLDPQTVESNKVVAGFEAGLAQTFYANGVNTNEKLQDGSELDFSGARVMLFASGFTLGLTLFDGYNTTLGFPYRDMQIAHERDVNNGDCTPGRTTPYQWDYCMTADRGLKYPEFSSVAVELAVPLGAKWTAKAEIVTADTYEGITLPTKTSSNLADVRAVNGLFAHLVNPSRGDLAGKALKERQSTVVSFGADYVGERWVTNLQFVSLSDSYSDDELTRLEDAASNPPDDTASGFPLLSFTRKLGSNDEGYAGLGFGAFFQSFGGGFYGGWTFFESLEIGGFMGMTESVSGEPDSTELYENDTAGAVVQFGANFRF